MCLPAKTFPRKEVMLMDCTFLEQAIESIKRFIAENPLPAIVITIALWKWIKSGDHKSC